MGVNLVGTFSIHIRCIIFFVFDFACYALLTLPFSVCLLLHFHVQFNLR